VQESRLWSFHGSLPYGFPFPLAGLLSAFGGCQFGEGYYQSAPFSTRGYGFFNHSSLTMLFRDDRLQFFLAHEALKTGRSDFELFRLSPLCYPSRSF